MRRILLICVLQFSIIAHAQNGADTIDRVQQNQEQVADSPKTKDSAPTDTSYKSIEIRDGNMQRVLELTREMEKRRERDKRNAMIRIGIGVLFLGVLVFGLLRKKKG